MKYLIIGLKSKSSRGQTELPGTIKTEITAKDEKAAKKKFKENNPNYDAQVIQAIEQKKADNESK